MKLVAPIFGGDGTQSFPNDGGEEIQPTAPPPDIMDTIQGYGGLGFDGSGC